MSLHTSLPHQPTKTLAIISILTGGLAGCVFIIIIAAILSNTTIYW